MKKYTLIMILALTIGSCREKEPNIKLEPDTARDTTYMSSVPAAQPRNVLVEEYTGTSCTNCPSAHVALEGYQKDHEGRINVIGMYSDGGSPTKPPNTPHVIATYDLRQNDATDIATSIYGGVGAFPSAGVDRLPSGVNGMKQDRSLWGASIKNGLDMPDSVNLSLESTYDGSTGIATVVATISYPMAISFAHNLNIVLVQDSIVDAQEYSNLDPVHPGGDQNYVFTNVIRGALSALPNGDPIYANIPVKEPGRVVVRVYTYDTKKIGDRAYNPAKMAPFVPGNCRVIGFITATSGTYRVLQSAQTTLK